MADSNFSQSPYLTSHAPGHRQSDSPASPSVLPPGPTLGFGSSFSYGSSYHYVNQNAFESQLPPVLQSSNSPFGHYHNRPSGYGQFSSPPRAPNLYPLGDSHMSNLSPAPSPPGPYRSQQMPNSLHPDLPDLRNEAGPSFNEPPLPGNPQFYPLPSYGSISTPSGNGYLPFPARRPGQSGASPISGQSGHFSGHPLWSPYHQRRGGSMISGLPSPDPSRQITSPLRRASHERQQQSFPAPGGPGGRPPQSVGPNGRRSDRSVSPRTSNRRSFDRYSTDLPPLSSPDAEEAAGRARSRRRLRERAMARQSALYADPNIPSSDQMQALKDKLRHLLPTELPEDASTCCDICQKDYSAKHCLPTEEDEVAILLPCKHIFGEHCINTWFETCKTHKNKITCPMCRKLLIEPRTPGSFAHAVPPELMAFLSQSLHRHGMGPDLLQLVRRGELEGDFSD